METVGITMQLRCMNVPVKLPHGQACSASYVRQQCVNIRAPYQALHGGTTSVVDQGLYIDFEDEGTLLHVPSGSEEIVMEIVARTHSFGCPQFTQIPPSECPFFLPDDF